MIAPLINSNEIREENKNNDISKKEIEIHRDNDNELTNLLNNERSNKQSIISYFRTINIKLNDNEKKGIVFLSFVIQLLIYFLLLKFSLNKIEFITDYSTLLYVLSLIIITIIFIKEDSLIRMSSVGIIIVALIIFIYINYALYYLFKTLHIYYLFL